MVVWGFSLHFFNYQGKFKFFSIYLFQLTAFCLKKSSSIELPNCTETQFLHLQSADNIYSTLLLWNQIQAYLILLCFTVLHFAEIAFFTHWRFVATLCWASLLAPFFQQHLLILCLSHFSNSHNISNPPWAERVQLTESSDDGYIFKQYFLIKK